MKTTPQKTTSKRTVSMHADLLEAAKIRAFEDHRTFSSYIAKLIADDWQTRLYSESLGEKFVAPARLKKSSQLKKTALNLV
jgi:hypothetical protein